ncbi:MAG: cysteine peptidase family C39 domain-containing protein, partial [bacterium]|nr:cysteine peptidase family C39 domain-containing protein [bacterium]
DRKLLITMEETRTNYDDQKKEVEKLKSKLAAQKKLLDKQKKDKESLLEITRGDQKRYQQLLAEAKAQLAAIRRFVASQGGATILNNQTKCDSWGCYYNQRDSLWGNIGLGGSSYSVAEYGCLISSVSMLASHYGKNIKPNDIAVIPNAFFEGYLLHSFSVNGVSVSLESVSKGRLDEELNAGRPVIAGLFSGPDHFIVILRKEGNGYIMHDPFLEDGANRPLSDKYSVSNISSLRLVRFN